VSDNFENVEGKFDLVVVSPPKYCNIQKNHKMGHLREDLRPSDVNWCIHREFYANIASHLTADAELWIAEVEPFSQEVELLGEIYDKRPNVPIIDFVNMMTDGGVRLEAIIPFPMGHLMMALFKVRLI